MKRIRRWSLVVTILGGAFLALPGSASAESSEWCGLCYQSCPTQGAMEGICSAHCGGSDGPPQCVWNPLCHELWDGLMVLCRGEPE